MKIAIAGDVFLGGDLLEHGSAPIMDCPAWHAADRRIVNLEHPISDDAKLTGMLWAPGAAVAHLKEMAVDAVGLANNHAFDMGAAGLADTRRLLADAGIGVFGAGAALDEARGPYWLSEDLCILGYCEHGTRGMARVRVATDGSAGVAPLDPATISADLAALAPGKRAILMFHWGRENAWLPPPADIALARKLLADHRVALIAGSHGHLWLGSLRRGDKRALMGLGNFLIPNFYLAPGYKLAPPPRDRAGCPMTRDFHNVTTVTYIKWRRANRLSGIAVYDSATGATRCLPVYQEDDRPLVRELGGAAAMAAAVRVGLLGLAQRLPAPLYRRLQGRRHGRSAR